MVQARKTAGDVRLLTVDCSGTGYIGSFTSLALLENGYEVVIVDNLYNSSEVALDRIELISGKRPKFYKVDITDKPALDKVFEENPEIDSVIHFAALKASLIRSRMVAQLLPVGRTKQGLTYVCRPLASPPRSLSSTIVSMSEVASPCCAP